MDTNHYRWTHQANLDLFNIVQDHIKNGEPNWKEIRVQFKDLYPLFEGKEPALRIQYGRFQKSHIKDTNACQHNFALDRNKFEWSNEVVQNLVQIVTRINKSNRSFWPQVLKEFQTSYSNFKGTTRSLQQQYYRYQKLLTNVKSKGEIELPSYTKFEWTNQAKFDLTRLVHLICVDGYPNWSKIYYTFCQQYANFDGTKTDLREYFSTMKGSQHGSLETLQVWDENKSLILAQAVSHGQNIRAAQSRDGRKKIVDPLSKLVVKSFKEVFKKNTGIDYINSDALILNQYFKFSCLEMTSTCKCSKETDPVTNWDISLLLACASKNHSATFLRIFNECCHNCGTIFPRSQKNLRKLQHVPINGSPNSQKMLENVPYNIQYGERFITCIECDRNPSWLEDYMIGLSIYDTSIPSELHSLNEYEQNQIALCGGFYSIYQKQNLNRRIFEHRQGECNIGKKRDQDYYTVFTTYYNIERPHAFPSSNERIKLALRWLKQNNHLYKDFLSNYETLYGYLMSLQNTRPNERILQISKGRLEDLVDRDTAGLLIPAENVKIEDPEKVELNMYGVQHPMQSQLNKVRNIINVHYRDPNLEAKRWPCLFPFGTGSWKYDSSLKQQTYVKKRLLSLDSRFRRNKEFMFFWYDRLIKQRLSYFNNRQKTVNIKDLVDQIRVCDLKRNQNKYGTTVPSSIPGSKTYWRARTSDLLALVRDLGKPDLFVTLTQNDNWPELQLACGLMTSAELNSIEQSIMQPALGGKPVVDFPVETVAAFFKRLEIFMRTFIHDKNGPFGEVLDYWYRIEYQNRGALHCHMIVWICEETMPENVVMAEMPRYSGTNTDVLKHICIVREYVKAFQMHACLHGRCLKHHNSTKCKYGFPFDIQHEEIQNGNKMGYTYIRRSTEDSTVVPYNIYALLCWNGHLNVQKVTSNGIEAYLCKYVSKPEKGIDIRDITSDANKFLKARVVGILECVSHLLQYQQVRSTRKTIFLPCDFIPNHKMLKRKIHLPENDDSEDVYYQTLLQKYLVRPKELQELTYVDMYRFYDVISSNARGVYTQSSITQATDSESESELQQKTEESEQDFSGRVRKIRSERAQYVSAGFKYCERGRAAVPRWRFIVPFSNESEKYYEQHLLLNVPIKQTELDLDGYPFSPENVSKTFVEECCIRGLINSEETAKSALLGAIQRGFSIERVIEIAKTLIDQSFVCQEYVDSILVPWMDTMPEMETQDLQCNDDEHGEELSRLMEMRVKVEPYETYVAAMTNSQKNVMEWVDRKIQKHEQVLAILTGGAGVGKSYITKALYSYFVEKKLVVILLATTGSAAHLISGTTVHFYLKIDIEGNKYLQPGTISAAVVEDTDVIILDEFSMLTSDMLDLLNDCTKQFGKSPRSPFGGKHIFLVGDPLQIPSIGKSVFFNPMLGSFSILLLKETVRQADISFAGLLNRVRLNEMTDSDKLLLKQRYTHVSDIKCDDDTLIVTATRKKMNYYNNKFIEHFPGSKVVILAQDYERDTNNQVNASVRDKIRLYVRNLWDEELVLKEGCIVRLLRNIDVSSGWVNSKRAKVFRLSADGSYIVLRDIEDESKQLPLTKMRQQFKLGANQYYRLQYPLKLGYSTTVHSVQGTTVTGNYYVDLDRSFWESGQAFVALSRPQNINQLHLLNTHFEKVFVKPYYKNLLNWMTEVDELALFKKPRIFGDFPLMPVENDTAQIMHVFPPPTDSQSHKVAKTAENTEFRPPRKIGQKQFSDNSRNIVELNRKIYVLCDNFMTKISRSTHLIEQLRFGAKFADLFLNEINSKLDIFSVVDPYTNLDSKKRVLPNVLANWNQKSNLACSTLQKYSCQFDAEFTALASLVKSLCIYKYTGQTCHAGISDIEIGNQTFRPVKTSADGRCFYHSVSFNLIGTSFLANTLKVLLAFSILKNQFAYEDIFRRLDSSIETAVLKSLSYNCWADIDVIFGMSIFLHRPITVVSRLDVSFDNENTTYNPLDSEEQAVMIGYVRLSDKSCSANHFIALLALETLSTIRIDNVSNQVVEFGATTLSDSDVEMCELTHNDSDDSL